MAPEHVFSYSSDLRAFLHGGNSGSNPVEDANLLSNLRSFPLADGRLSLNAVERLLPFREGRSRNTAWCAAGKFHGYSRL